jgi:hypothetical protein
VGGLQSLGLKTGVGVGVGHNRQGLEVEVGELGTVEEEGVALDHWRIQMID